MVACLCIHGFTGSPKEVEPLADYLREHTDWDILTPTLPGHDHLRHLKNVTYKDWIVFVDSILSQMLKEDEEVYIIGFSMGGLLAGWLARHYPEVKKLVLLSTAVNAMEWPQIVENSKQVLAEAKEVTLKNSPMFKRYQKKVTETPWASTLQFQKMVALAKPVFEHIEIPTFIAQGSNDSVVPAEKSVQFLMDSIPGPKELFILEGSEHVICQDKQAEQLFEAVLAFLQKDLAVLKVN
ncbi:alpha/beta hydrolase [Listeria ivanovii]|uniref:alpha/beta hydrolase n=1 Tax=Listeria ivanovii TaxID=1638 RepID=UPI001940ECBF|nr:alpha/beta fold hydrolase [Listeria ivanovii]MBM5607707.1 alpha/beta fold hydrolase [Listeria ivanovii]MBM5637829.1 alpha/beta fold hydrolase [Listeria ivanovii]MBM5705461.1 alpha/beta fold hydrolase [Listeria ivanovii]